MLTPPLPAAGTFFEVLPAGSFPRPAGLGVGLLEVLAGCMNEINHMHLSVYVISMTTCHAPRELGNEATRLGCIPTLQRHAVGPSQLVKLYAPQYSTHARIQAVSLERPA